MRVALFHPEFQAIGSAEALAGIHAGYLEDEGFDLEVLTFRCDAEPWTGPMGRIPVRIIPRKTWSDTLFAFMPTGRARRLAARLRRSLAGFDVVVAHNYPCSSLLGIARMPGRKLWYCHEPPRSLHLREANPNLSARLDRGGSMDSMACRNFEHRMARYVARMERRSSLRARQQFDLKGIRPLDGIAANSEFTRDNIQAIYGQAPVRVIPPVVRIPPRIMARQGLDRTGLQVLVHSRLEVSKNIDTVLRGFALFRCRQPGARLHVVGEGRNRAALEALARELLPEGGCQFHGVLPEAELQRVYEACQVMVTLPLDEPFGMVLPEAAVQGLLLVGSDHGGNLEILDGGRLGWAVDPFAPESLEEALVQISALSDGEADRRRQAADLACRNRYTLEVIGPQLSAFLQG